MQVIVVPVFIGVESHPYRAELARKLGAEVVLNPNDEDILESNTGTDRRNRHRQSGRLLSVHLQHIG